MNTIVYSGLPINFTCGGPPGTNDFRWIVNGSHWTGSITRPGLQAKVFGDHNTTLRFNTIPMSANHTKIYCKGIVNPLRYGDHRVRKKSRNAVLIIRGIKIMLEKLMCS